MGKILHQFRKNIPLFIGVLYLPSSDLAGFLNNSITATVRLCSTQVKLLPNQFGPVCPVQNQREKNVHWFYVYDKIAHVYIQIKTLYSSHTPSSFNMHQKYLKDYRCQQQQLPCLHQKRLHTTKLSSCQATSVPPSHHQGPLPDSNAVGVRFGEGQNRSRNGRCWNTKSAEFEAWDR